MSYADYYAMGSSGMFMRLNRRVCGRLIAILCSLLISLGTLRADLITTIDGQTLEGLIRDENRFSITLDVRGVVIPIPRERIRDITRASLDDNVRSLLDRALEARSRDDLSTARTLIEQARALNSRNPALVESMRQQDKELTDLERRGGTPEERRARAAVLLERANEAYDKVRIDEANGLLLQALKTDPTYESAQRRMSSILTTSQNVDMAMAGEYFVDAVYPENMTPGNPVLPLLPQVYVELANRFDQGTDITRAQRYAELMIAIHKAFQEQPALARAANEEARGLINQPVDQLLSTLVENNLKRGSAEFALRKLQGWADPMSSPQMALLFTRAYVGAGDFSEAADVLNRATQAFPEDTSLAAHKNALDLIMRALASQKLGNQAEALPIYEQVFAARTSLEEEVGLAVGKLLADIKYQQLAAIQPGTVPPSGYQIADVAAHVLRYSTDRTQQRKAAEVLVAALPRVAWHLDMHVTINNVPVTVSPELKTAAQQALSRPFNVLFDEQSPFKLTLLMSLAAEPTSATAIAAALSPGSAGLAGSIPFYGLTFAVQADHPALGTIINQSWREPAPSPAALERYKAAGVAPPEGATPAFAYLQNPQSLTYFVQQDLPEYMLMRIGLLNSRLQLPQVQELLGPAPVG